MEKKATLNRNAPYQLDSEVAEALGSFLSNHPPGEAAKKGDWQGLRDTANDFYKNLNLYLPVHEGIKRSAFFCFSKDGQEITLRWYTKPGAGTGAAVVYVHGGGRLAGSVDLYDKIVADFVHRTDVAFLSVGYRLPPAGKDESFAEDVLAAITWLIDHAAERGIDPERIAVMGDSGGGGIAASAAMLARDRGIRLARQILLYPMLDDRTTVEDEALAPFAVWNYDSNYTGWKASMSAEPGSDDVSAAIVPMRQNRFEGLAPAYIVVGFLDIFRNENVAYAFSLLKSGVPVELHIHPGVPHAFDFLAPESAVAKRAVADHIRVIRSI